MADGTHAAYGAHAPRLGMAYERTTVSLTRMSGRMAEDRSERLHLEAMDRAVDPGLREPDAAENLRCLLKHRCGSIVAGWREAVDIRGVHFVGQADWFKAMRAVGFGGHARAAWGDLSGGRGQVTLADLDPAAAGLLSAFYTAYREEIGRLPELLGESDSLRVSKAAFLEKCAALRQKVKGRAPVDLEAAFANLQTVAGMLTVADCAWLEHYCERGQKSSPSNKAPESEALPSRMDLAAVAARKKAVAELKRQLQHRFGGVVQGWRALLDREGNGGVTSEELEAALEGLQLGEAAAIWEELVVDADAGVLTLKDLCPEGPSAIKEFKERCVECFGSVAAAFEQLHAKNKPLVTREDFTKLCREIKLGANHNFLFEFLDERGVGQILLASIDEKAATTACGSEANSNAQDEYRALEPLPRKSPHVTLRARAREQCGEHRKPPEEKRSQRKELLRVLQERFESPVRAWGSVFDPKGKGKLGKDEFFVGCSAAGFTGDKTSLWAELNLQPKQSVRLRDIAPEALKECGEFKSLSGQQLGRIITAMEAAGPRGASKDGAEVDEKRFQELCAEIGYKGPAKPLMTHLDAAGRGVVSSRSLRYFHEERREEKAVTGLLQKHQEMRQEKWREKLAGMRVAPVQELKAKQEGLLQMGREHRADRTGPENARRDVLSALSRKYGSIAKAWRLALNPKDAQQLTADRFLDGLKRAGVVAAKPEKQEVEKYQRLYEYLLSGDKKATGLRLQHLDPKVDDSLQELKVRCAERFGSLWQAFEEFDPEGTGIISDQAFRRMCHEAKVTDGIHRMLHYLDPDSDHEIDLEEIDKEAADDAKDACEERKEDLERQRARDERLKRTHMTGEPPSIGSNVGVEVRREERQMEVCQKVLTDLKQRLVKKHGNLVRAWRAALCAPGEGSGQSVGLEQFRAACREAGVSGEPGDAWRALGLDPEQGASRLSLVQFEPSVLRDLREFRAHAKERFGSFITAFDEVDKSGSYQLDLTAFLAFSYECQFRGNERRLFEFLAPDGVLRLSALDRKAVEELKSRRTSQGDGAGAGAADAGDAGTGGAEGEGGAAEPGSPSASSSAGVAIAAAGQQRQDPAKVFRELVARRFGGSMVRAWRALDPEGRAVLTKHEFVRAVAATGYAGSPAGLWAAFVGEAKGLSLRDLDPEGSKLLAGFYRRCVSRLGRLAAAFEEEGAQDADNEVEPTKRYSHEEFVKLCKKVRCPKPWDQQLFQQLALRDAVTWNEVRFLEEQWDWKEEKPKRQQPKAMGASSPPSAFPDRVSGQGILYTSMRPRKVAPVKSNSLPSLFMPLRSNWNDRHQVLDHAGNKDEQLLHFMCHVQCQEQERLKRRVAQKMLEVPTAQWIAEHLPGDAVENNAEEY